MGCSTRAQLWTTLLLVDGLLGVKARPTAAALGEDLVHKRCHLRVARLGVGVVEVEKPTILGLLSAKFARGGLRDCGWTRAGVAFGHSLATSLAPRHHRFAEKLAMMSCCAVALLLLLVLTANLRSLLVRRLLGSADQRSCLDSRFQDYQVSTYLYK